MATAYNEEAQRARRVHDLADVPATYAAVGYGSCMEPVIKHGECLVFSKNDSGENGDVVGIWFKPDRIPVGQFQHFVKRLVMKPPVSFPYEGRGDAIPLVIVEMLNPPRTMRILATDIMAIHKCIGTAEPGENGMAKFRPSQGAPR